MPTRQTMNVSLAPGQESFVRTQVAVGRYRTASEVVREGLRLLEEAEHRRLLEKWLYEGLSDHELAGLPDEVKQRTREHFAQLVAKAEAEVREGHTVDGPTAMQRLRAKLEAQRG